MRERLTDRDNKFALEPSGSTRTRRVAFARTLYRFFLVDACRHSQRQRAREIASSQTTTPNRFPSASSSAGSRLIPCTLAPSGSATGHDARSESFLDAIVFLFSVVVAPSSSSSQNGSYHSTALPMPASTVCRPRPIALSMVRSDVTSPTYESRQSSRRFRRRRFSSSVVVPPLPPPPSSHMIRRASMMCDDFFFSRPFERDINCCWGKVFALSTFSRSSFPRRTPKARRKY